MSPRLIHDLLERAASTRGDHTAVLDGARTCAYGDLEDRANQIAQVLVDAAVRPGDRVGIYLPKSVDAVATVYGILKAGAAYVPLDSNAPSSRLGYITRNCELHALVTGGATAKGWPAVAREGGSFRHVVMVAPCPGEDPDARPDNVNVVTSEDVASASTAHLARSGGEDLAYILYTSGSTGEPKGVMLSHENALAFVNWAVEAVGVEADDRLSSHAPLHFDLSVFDLFAAATQATTLVLVPRKASVLPQELKRFLASSEITVWYSVPTALSLLAHRGGLAPRDLPRLRVVIFAGEVFPSPHLAALMNLLPDASFWNFYGPTETNVCTAYHVPAPPDPARGDIPIGRPIDGVVAHVVTDDATDAAQGEEGELLIGGPTVMRGYWAAEVKTKERLIADPRGGTGLVYRTGDLVIELPDGNFKFLGRRDHQIKSRGYRIELGEIESVLHAHPGVRECVAVAVPDELITNRICAHVVVRDDTSTKELARFCAERLPAYMIPDHFELWDTLPRTSTDKVDRQALRSDSPSRDQSR